MIDASDSEGQKGLEKGEIVIDSVGFILAGYETTSMHCSHLCNLPAGC